jgi:hypothetical protein
MEQTIFIKSKLLAWSAKSRKTPDMECKVQINSWHGVQSSNKLLAWSAKCSSIIQSYHIKALTPGMELKSELFHPTKIKIELTSFENFENELFTIFIKKKKNFNTLELTLGTEVNSIVQFVQKHHISILMETATMT